MTPDDDAFLRTIVDSPGHDLPRLVYADWLDDRDDPRGPFLRAEVEWAQSWKDGQRPGDATELRELAAGLDPLWVARVSRPPVGVCCDHLQFEGAGPILRGKDVDDIDRWPGVKLPSEYKAFLLNHNGGHVFRSSNLPGFQPSDSVASLALMAKVVPPGDPKLVGTLHQQVQRYWDRYLDDLVEMGRRGRGDSHEPWFALAIPIGCVIGFRGSFQDVYLGIRRTVHPNVFLPRDLWSNEEPATLHFSQLLADLLQRGEAPDNQPPSFKSQHGEDGPNDGIERDLPF